MPAVLASAKFFSRPCYNSSPFSCHNKQMITVNIKQINQFAGNQHCNGFSDFHNCFLLTGMFLYGFINSTNDHAAANGHWVNLQTRGPKSGPRYFFRCQVPQVPFLPLDLSGVLHVGVLISSHTLPGDICELACSFHFQGTSWFEEVSESLTSLYKIRFQNTRAELKQFCSFLCQI